MKKILILFMMVAGLMGSLYLDTLKISSDVEKSQTLSEIDANSNTVAYVKVDILQKDTLMYSFGENADNRLNIRKVSLAVNVLKQNQTYRSRFEVGWHSLEEWGECY